MTKIVTTPTPAPLPLPELLAQLAALPADQREALAVLLAPKQTGSPGPAESLDDRLPWERRERD